MPVAPGGPSRRTSFDTPATGPQNPQAQMTHPDLPQGDAAAQPACVAAPERRPTP